MILALSHLRKNLGNILLLPVLYSMLSCASIQARKDELNGKKEVDFLVKPRRVVLKFLNKYEGKFMGRNDKNRLWPVDFKDATWFTIEDTGDATKKLFKDNDNNEALSEVMRQDGWKPWTIRTYLYDKPDTNDSGEGMRLAYFGPNDYVLMQGEFCLGWDGSHTFRSRYCYKKDRLLHFGICTSQSACNDADPIQDLREAVKDLKDYYGLHESGTNMDDYERKEQPILRSRRHAIYPEKRKSRFPWAPSWTRIKIKNPLKRPMKYLHDRFSRAHY